MRASRSLGLTPTVVAANAGGREGREEGPREHPTPQELMCVLENLYRGKVSNKQFTEEFSLFSAFTRELYPRHCRRIFASLNKHGASSRYVRTIRDRLRCASART